jgi:hypothetical protein
METRRNSLKEEMAEEILNSTAGENVWTSPSEKGETNDVVTQEMLKNMQRENSRNKCPEKSDHVPSKLCGTE